MTQYARHSERMFSRIPSVHVAGEKTLICQIDFNNIHKKNGVSNKSASENKFQNFPVQLCYNYRNTRSHGR
jgi:hypothetical protein